MFSTQLIIFLYVFVLSCQGDLDDKFHYYEIIDQVEVSSIVKRNSDSHVKTLKLNAFGKNYTLELTPSKDLFTKDFKITVVHGDNSEDVIDNFDTSNFMTGHVSGDPNSTATIHIGQDNMVTGSFTAGNEEIGIEPLSDHIEDEGKNFDYGSKMIAYRRSEIKTDQQNQALCGSIHPDGIKGDVEEIELPKYKKDSSKSRTKRFAGPAGPVEDLKSCLIIAVADFRFYVHRGQSDIFDTANYIANIVNRMNLIYRSTNFGLGTGFGIELNQMRIHDGYSTNTFEYNYEKTYGASELLVAFSRYTQNNMFCLAHLFTSQAMPDSVLGLAYIASPVLGSPGGICSSVGTYEGATSTFNTGWTSSRNGAGSTITFLQNALVTSHGHSWGSEHDPSSGSCAPRNFLGGDGKYLMYAYSVTGEDPNNDQWLCGKAASDLERILNTGKKNSRKAWKFSSCSRGSIGAVISNKRQSCFTVPAEESLCGNGRIDENEECDGGFLGKVGLDPCCAKDCMLNEGALCSAANYPCCANCQVASPGLICRGLLPETCNLEASCDGFNYECPASASKPDNTPCLDGGSCIGGVCTSFCEARNRNSCVCDAVDTSCKRCCRDPATGACSVYDNSVFVADGRTCVQGYCENGNCIKIATDTIERLWELIDKVSINFLIESFKTNIVLCTTGFSLVLYIPICIAIWCYDKKRKRDWIKENTIHVRKDRGLAHDEDKRPVAANKPKPTPKPVVLDPNEYLVPLNRRPHRRNQLQPLNHKPTSSVA